MNNTSTNKSAARDAGKINSAVEEALKKIGYRCADIPSYRIEPGRVLISIADNNGEGDETIDELRRHLPDGAAAEWTGDSNTSGDGDTTSDCAITWR